MHASAILPGITFESAVPPLAEALPRMDIAAFVGFASTGPLDTPVAIEDPTRFRDIFGPDQALAWDIENGQLRYAQLGPTVETFFRNGGRRCWVVRVADEPQVHTFSLNHLIAIDSLEPAQAWARSGGSWCEDFEVSTVLAQERLCVGEPVGSPPSVLSLGSGAIELLVGAPVDEMTTGDLLKVQLDPGLGLYLFVGSAVASEGGSRIVASDSVWFEPESSSSTSMSSDLGLLDPGEAHSRLAALQPVSTCDIRRLTFGLLVWQGDFVIARIDSLAFLETHPRFWALLPSDVELFRSVAGRAQPLPVEATRQLISAASFPRFPIGAPHDGAVARAFLPLGMSVDVSRESAAGIESVSGSKLERDGLSSFSWRLFVDSDLALVGARNLSREAKHKYYIRRQALLGLHSLLPIHEPTLIAIPDAGHENWTQLAPPPPTPLLDAPVIRNSDQQPIEPDFRIFWTEVDGVDRYELQRADDPDFVTALEAFSESDTEHILPLLDRCQRAFFFRVRALRDDEVSPWSNTLELNAAGSTFVPCEAASIVALDIYVHASGSPSLSHIVSWSEAGVGSPASSFSGDLHFELESAQDPAFLTASVIYNGTEASFELDSAKGAATYLRVRARHSERIGRWSNTVRLDPDRIDWTLLPPDKLSLDLLAIQRALLRFCSARRDLFAALSVARHFRAADVREHLRRLRPATDNAFPATLSSGVPPLRFHEAPILGYGALFHPWIVTPSEQQQQIRNASNLAAQSPDGAVTGSMAARSLTDGAWIAPANRKLGGVIALQPALDVEDQELLVSKHVNPLIQDPRGFLIWNADTLSPTTERRPINVRRLLMLLHRLAIKEGSTWVFEPNDLDFHGRVRHRFEQILSHLFVRGAFAGELPEHAYRVVVDASVNPPEALDNGRFVVELRVAPSQPLAFLKVRLVQDGPERLFLEEL